MPFRFRQHGSPQNRIGEGSLLPEGKVPGPAKDGSRNALDAESIVIDRGGRIAQRLLNVFWLEKRVLREERAAVRIGCEQLQNATNGDPHPADARFSGTLARLYRN